MKGFGEFLQTLFYLIELDYSLILSPFNNEMPKKTLIINIFTLLFLIIGYSLASQSIADSLISELEKTHELENKIDLYLKISKSYQQSDLENAVKYANDALLLAENSGSNTYTGRIYSYLGEYRIQQDSIVLAESYFNKAKEFLDIDERPLEAISIYLSIGNRYIEKDKYADAMKYYLDAIVISEEKDIKKLLPNLYNNLGVVYLNTRNEEKALNYYSKALELFKERGDTSNYAGTTTNIGSIYIELGQNKIAKKYYKSGYDIFEDIGSLEGMAHSVFKLGLLDLYEENYDSALINLGRSLELQKEIEIIMTGSRSFFLAETYINMGIASYYLNSYQDAKRYLIEGYNIALNTSQFRLISLASKYLSYYFKANDDFEVALEYYEVYKQYSDSTLNEESIRNLAQTELQHEFDSRLKEEELRQTIEMQRVKRRNLIYIIISVGLFMLLIIAALLLRLEKIKKHESDLEKKNLEEKLEHTNKELTTYVMYLLRKNEFIISIAEKLKVARLEAKTENKKIMSDMIKELESNSSNLSWEEFEVRFQKVYTGFYKTLNTKFPDLTPNELRLCAFFRLNMTTKEIAAITYQSINSITVARYRLRKKLNLNSEENLVNFLTKL